MASMIKQLTRTVSCHIERNLAALQNLPRVSLNNIKDFDEAFKKKQRKGRGRGSGRGKTSGRGHKGQGQRNTLPRIGFEGGQHPLYLRVPKHGATKKPLKPYATVNLNKLQYFIDSGRIDVNKPITMHTLKKSGAVSQIKNGVILGQEGADWFKAKIDIEVSKASPGAVNAVEREGGKITAAFYNKLGLRALLKPEAFADRVFPRRARPRNEELIYYADPDKRGYLANEKEVEARRLKNRSSEDQNQD